jgi:hypothetical protein
MSYWVTLVDTTAPHWCSYGQDPATFVPTYPGDEPCSAPCYPAVQVTRHSEGGTYALDGTTEATLNVTYNYCQWFQDAWNHASGKFDGQGDGWLGKMLGEKKAKEVIDSLERAVAFLGTEQDDDYWKPTPGNAGYALNIILGWCREHTDATIQVH